MDKDELNRLLSALDETNPDQNWAAIRELEHSGVNIPRVLLEHYRASRSWRGRVSCVFFCIPYARKSDDAVQLGTEALKDKSKVVRHRACSLLAYSLRDDTVSNLRQLLVHDDPSTVDDARAAIDAIEHRNHHFFLDRSHNGKMTWTVEEN